MSDKKTSTQVRFRDWTLFYNPKPIPDRRFDYDAVRDDYDGDNGMYICTSSFDECQLEIIELEHENQDRQNG